jgi:mono/diheme cytochrome c family protein
MWRGRFLPLNRVVKGKVPLADTIMSKDSRPMHPQSTAAARLTFLTTIFVIILLSFGSRLAAPAHAQQQRPTTKPANNSQVARGKYLVENVAMCSQCHTPRDGAGNLDRSRWLQGGPLWYQPAHPVPDWPLQVPRIGGSISATDAELVTLLTTGIWRDGKHLRPPMQQFRMTTEDASAVVAYLRSLNPSSPAEQEPQ